MSSTKGDDRFLKAVFLAANDTGVSKSFSPGDRRIFESTILPARALFHPNGPSLWKRLRDLVALGRSVRSSVNSQKLIQNP